MNFLLCNRCKKRSEDNIFNLNSNNYNELSQKRKHINSKETNIDNNIINQADTSEKFQPMDYLKNSDEINMNIKDLEEDSDDDLKIIEYPYKQLNIKKKSNLENKLRQKEFKNNKSKFNDNFFDEQNILNKLSDIASITNIKYQIKPKDNKKNIIEKKDTFIDPSNLALTNLFFDINKISLDRNKSGYHQKNNNNKNNKQKEEENNSGQNIKYFINNKNEQSKNKNIINVVKKENHKKKSNKNICSNYIKSENNRVKISEYSNIIKKKKNILKNRIISNKNLYINNLSISNLIINSKKNNFTKSYSFNSFENANNNNINKYRNETANNILKNNKKGNTVLFSPHIKKNKSKIKFNL